MTNSAGTRRSDTRRISEAAAVWISLSVLIAAFVAWVYRSGYVLYYGDAQSHLDLSRAILDSRTPGYDQLGTVWLPLLHVMCLPLAANDWLWSTGLAGSAPVAICFVVAGCCFYFAAKEAYASSAAAAVALSCFALNPNILYLASIPMTEVVFFAALAVFLYCLVRFRSSQHLYLVALGIAASWAMSLTRYDGWFLLPFEAVWFACFAKKRRLSVLIAFGFLAALAPLYWCLHCWWESGNLLEFYNGPFSPQAIQGGKSYPGYHNWPVAFAFYAFACELCSGSGLILVGICGTVCAIRKRVFAPLGFLCLLLAFYVWSVHSSGLPIYLPQLWYGSYYNSRYGLAMIPAAGFAAGALLVAVPPKWNRRALILVPLLAIAPWLLHPGVENWICWKESEVNSISRRAWTREAVNLVASIDRDRQGILTSWGDVPGIFCRARIPIAETLNIGNGPAWFASSTRPDLAHQTAWAVAQDGDPLSKALHKPNSAYVVVREIRVKGAPALEIYRRRIAPVPPLSK